MICLLVWDKKKILYGYVGGVVKVWDSLSGECLSMFGNHAEHHFFFPFASSPDFFKITCASHDPTMISVYDKDTGNILHTIQAQSNIEALCFSPDGHKIVHATGSSVGVFDLTEGVTILTWKLPLFYNWRMHPRSSFFAISPDGDCVQTIGLEDGVLKVFKMERGHQDDGIHDQHSNNVQAVAFALNGQMVALASFDSVKL
jgi:WD40 repeat protein